MIQEWAILPLSSAATGGNIVNQVEDLYVYAFRSSASAPLYALTASVGVSIASPKAAPACPPSAAAGTGQFEVLGLRLQGDYDSRAAAARACLTTDRPAVGLHDLAAKVQTDPRTANAVVSLALVFDSEEFLEDSFPQLGRLLVVQVGKGASPGGPVRYF
jgi:hypothetical protein